MIVLISACDISWWMIPIAMSIPFVLGWLLRSEFAKDDTARCKKRIKDLEFELKRCAESKHVISTTQVNPEIKFSDIPNEDDTLSSKKAKNIKSKARLSSKSKSQKEEEKNSKQVSKRNEPLAERNKIIGESEENMLDRSSLHADELSGESPIGKEVPEEDSDTIAGIAASAADSKKLKPSKTKIPKSKKGKHHVISSDTSKDEKETSKGKSKSQKWKKKKKSENAKSTIALHLYRNMRDNLEVVEGIGPKMNAILQENGISTWEDLGNKKANAIKVILSNYGDRYRIIDPKHWPKQARLAEAGEWDKLIEFQKGLGSRKGGGSTPSKAEKILQRLGYRKKYERDDLKIIEGIGPKIAGLLKDAGIQTWKQLSEVRLELLEEVLNQAGKRYQLADPTTWAQQARLAEEGDFEGLEVLQSQLKGGRPQ